MMMQRWALLLAVGALGGWLARRFRMPGGAFLGAMLSTALVSLWLSEAQPLPEPARWLALLLLGIYTGSKVEREAVRRLWRALPVALVLIGALIAVAVGLGWVVYAWAGKGLAPVTVLLGIMPGGASGLSAVAYDLHADARLVAAMHSVRQMVVLGVLPLALRAIARRHQNGPPHRQDAS